MDEDGPVTVVIRHRVKPGREAEFEGWLRDITRAAIGFPGYLGNHISRPADARRPEYLVLLKFDGLAHLEAWENSDVRRACLEKAQPLTASPPTRERHTGMEVWFSPPAGRTAPPRYKLIPVTLLAIYPLISLVQLTLSPLLADWPVMLRTLVTSLLLTGTMTYVVMPVMTRLFDRWLYGPAER